jgi:glycosyltransferase involved in cell wall biosynthesis
MKIIVIGTRGFPNVPGGIETHCEHLYPNVVKKGCKVSVITRKAYVDPAINEFKGVNLFAIWNTKNKFLESIVHTFFAIFKAKKLGCDLIHLHGIGPALLVPMARLLGLKVVMTNHGPDYNRLKWGLIPKIMLRLGEFLGSKFSNKVISISKPIADNLKNIYNCDAVFIPNGVVIPEIVQTEHSLVNFGLDKKKYILTIGRFVLEKGFTDLISAFKKSNLANNGFKLVIVGDANYEDKYSRILKQIAAEDDNIVLTGFQKGLALHELFSHTKLFILPSYHEGLPIVLLEAMSYGLSCIVSDIPANRNVNLPNNRYFILEDITGFAKKLSEFANKDFSDEDRKLQIEQIRSDYDLDTIAKETVELYQEVCSTLN